MELEKIKLDSRISVFTEEGLDKIISSNKIAGLAATFCLRSTVSEKFLEGTEHIGVGNHSAVWATDGVALKVSSFATGKNAWRQKGSTRPENLITQFKFLDTFRKILDQKSDGMITVPKQYFAIKNSKGDYLRGEEQMSDWISINLLLRDLEIEKSDQYDICESIKNRIAYYLGSSLLKSGLTDVGLEQNRLLHGGNVMLPRTTVDPENAPICIIDQPGRGIKGFIASGLLNTIISNKFSQHVGSMTLHND
ncbi:MAG: hypothetical protein WCG30_02395 [Candidatus Saccharibacteria bacterium]